MAEPRRQATLGEYLVREGIITQTQLNKALDVQTKTMRSIGRILVELELVTESMRMTILRKQFGFEVASLKNVKVDPIVLAAIPYAFAEKHRVVPLRVETGTTLVVAMEDPSDLLVTDAIKNQVGLKVRAVAATIEDVQWVLNQYQTGSEEQPILTTPKKYKPTLMARIARTLGFWALALLPLELLAGAIKFDWFSAQHVLNQLGSFNLSLYTALIWGLWTILLWEFDGILFNPKQPSAD